MSEDQVAITARCLCGSHSFTAHVPANALPLEASCCHCDSCRHVSGALYFVGALWPTANEDLSSLRKYSFSKNTDMFFCGTCSALMFCRGAEAGAPAEVIAGALENAPNLVKYTKHIFVGDTLDGGASMWLRNSPDGTIAKRWVRRSIENNQPGEELPYDWPPRPTTSEGESRPMPELTPIRCHCAGVNLTLRNAADMASSPAADLPFFVDPKTYKYLATTDACDSCRLSCGADLMNWTFALLSHIGFPPDAQAVAEFPRSSSALKAAVSPSETRDPLFGTLTYYQSSPGVERYFCSRCSATVFYAAADRPDLVDVAIGLLHHPSGALAEGLLSWDLGRIGWREDVVGGWREQLARRALEEADEWRVERGCPKSWRRLIAEQNQVSN